MIMDMLGSGLPCFIRWNLVLLVSIPDFGRQFKCLKLRLISRSPPCSITFSNTLQGPDIYWVVRFLLFSICSLLKWKSSNSWQVIFFINVRSDRLSWIEWSVCFSKHKEYYTSHFTVYIFGLRIHLLLPSTI